LTPITLIVTVVPMQQNLYWFASSFSSCTLLFGTVDDLAMWEPSHRLYVGSFRTCTNAASPVHSRSLFRSTARPVQGIDCPEGVFRTRVSLSPSKQYSARLFSLIRVSDIIHQYIPIMSLGVMTCRVTRLTCAKGPQPWRAPNVVHT
jgi:hypothetical protein